MLRHVCQNTYDFVRHTPKDKRKGYGQFFTSEQTADYMARLFDINMSSPCLHLLDAGAGSGILSAALAARIREVGYTGQIKLTCYENDPSVTPLLEENLAMIREQANIEYEVINDNYLTSQSFSALPTLFDTLPDLRDKYDLVIGNPPYKKIPKDALEAVHMSDVCHGAPNLYFLFWAMAIRNARPGGQIVYIIPRSWTSGLYFERFRQYLFEHCVITDLHLFESRDKVFDGESVLQETMIVKVRKSCNEPANINVTTSETSDFDRLNRYTVPYKTIVSPSSYVYLVTNQTETDTLKRIGQFTDTLVSNDLRMKTGIIVDFRSRKVLRDEEGRDTYPLIYSQHIRNGRVHWPIGKQAEYICTDHDSFLQRNTNYLFVKRFTAKEEPRRLQCGIYLSANYPQYEYISTQNKINYIQCHCEDEVFGLYTLFNSTLYDRYYRILNGSTQVNATEINCMPVPPHSTIIQMGRELRELDLSQISCDKIIDKWIKLKS